MPKGKFELKTMTVIAVAMMVFGPLATATFWSPGTYGLGSGSVSWPSMDARSAGEVVTLGAAEGQANSQETAAEAVQLGRGGQTVTEEPNATAMQLGNGTQVVSQGATTGPVQLSGYYDNMGSYRNVLYPSVMLGGTFSSSGGGGCGCS